MTASAYIICATPRSGSTMLCDLLGGSGIAGRPHSYYREPSIPNWASRLGVAETGPYEGTGFDRAYLDAVLREGSNQSGIFGLRLMWSSVDGLSRRLEGLFPGLPNDAARFARAFGPCRYLHLSRADKVAQAVSRLRAEQTGLWHLAADGSERERTAPPRPAVYDAAGIGTFLDEAERDDAAWHSWFKAQGIAPFRLTYEELVADPTMTLSATLAALQVDGSRAAPVELRSAHMADETSAAWVARFRLETGRG